MAVATGQPPQRLKRSMRLWMATAVAAGLPAFVWMKWIQRRRTSVSEPVGDRLPIGLGLE